MELSIREGSEVPAFIMQGEELRVRFDYKVTGQPAPHEDHDLLPLRRRGQLEEQQRDHSPRAWSV